jgi:hypothetical protein
MVPPAGRGVAGVKDRVTGTEALPAMRSVEAIANDTDLTCPVMPPDSTAKLGNVSADVRTVTPGAPAVNAPIMIPEIVTVNTDVPIAAPDVVITTDVAAVAPHVAVRPETLLAPDATVGVTDGAKKPEG